MNCEECPYREAAIQLATKILEVAARVDEELEKREIKT